jgi:hypothetical protein
MLLLFSLISTGFVLARVTTFREYSAVMTDVTGTYQYVASMVPDPVTGIEQPIIVVNTSTYNYVGGIHSYVGGVAIVGSSYVNLRAGHRYLEQFDLSSKGWLTWPSTTVSKTAQGTVVYSRNCTRTFWCAYPSSGQISSLNYGYVVALEVDRRGSPLFMNVSYSPNNFFQFKSFSQQASTYQTDSSVYTLPASFYSSAPRQPPNITTLSFYRSATNDSFIRNIWNDNVATASGEASWAGCQRVNTPLLFFRLDLQIDQNFGQYLLCNSGMCPNYYLDVTQRMGANVSCVFCWCGALFPHHSIFRYFCAGSCPWRGLVVDSRRSPLCAWFPDRNEQLQRRVQLQICQDGHGRVLRQQHIQRPESQPTWTNHNLRQQLHNDRRPHCCSARSQQYALPRRHIDAAAAPGRADVNKQTNKPKKSSKKAKKIQLINFVLRWWTQNPSTRTCLNLCCCVRPQLL